MCAPSLSISFQLGFLGKSFVPAYKFNNIGFQNGKIGGTWKIMIGKSVFSKPTAVCRL
jgi:hypothetical protein